MKPFSRRLYASFGEFWADVHYVFGQRAYIRPAMRQWISPQFRERLMLMVTQVNGCRYCSYFHARQALRAGISAGELESLLVGALPGEAPAGEHPALLYAQHWAEANARPDPEIVQRVTDFYGIEKTRAIHIVLHMIRMGNLLGNLGDYLLYRLSFGRLGLLAREQGKTTSP
jgi:AhpD family alkylhydroperoxidase